MKKITIKWLKKHKACVSLDDMKQAEKIGDIKKIINKLIKDSRLKDANWLITKYMNKKQNLQYAIFVAELVLYIFEKKYTSDNRPRKAIKTVKKYLKNPIGKNKAAAAAAADAAFYAVYAVYINTDVAVAATAIAAATAAAAAVYAVYAVYINTDVDAAAAADIAAVAAANADTAAATAAANAIRIKILKYGLKIIYGEIK